MSVTGATWIKSNRCESANCVEAAADGQHVYVRNSEGAATIRFTRDEWQAFLGGVLDGDFDFGLAVTAPTKRRA